MEKYKEDIKHAAVAIDENNGEKLEALSTDILTADIPPTVTDKDLERDPESRREAIEMMDDEEAVRRCRGTTFLGTLKKWFADAKRVWKASRKRWKSKEDKLDKFEDEHRQRIISGPLIGNDLFKVVFLGGLAAAAVLADSYLLNGQIREWLCGGQAAQNPEVENVGTALAAFLIVSLLAFVAHLGLDEEAPRWLRALAMAFVAVLGVCLGSLRAYTISDSDSILNMVIGAIVWTLVSLSAPLVAACCIRKAHPCLERLIISLENSRRWAYLRRLVMEDAHRAAREVSSMKAELDGLLQEFEAPRQRLLEREESESTMARAARRWRNAMLARLRLFWMFLKKQRPPFDPRIILYAGAALLLVLVLMSMGCAAPPPPKPANWVVVCDRSSSSSEKPACSRERLQDVCKQWAKLASVGGGRIELLLMGQSISDTQSRLLAEHQGQFRPPVRRNRTKWEHSVEESCSRTELPMLSDASGVVEGIYAGISRLRGLKGDRNALVLLSDMRQVTPGVWNFEKKVPDYANFSRWLDSLGQVDTSDLKLAVCGFNTGTRTSPVATAEHIKLRELWERAFREKWHFKNQPMLSEECQLDDLTQSRK